MADPEDNIDDVSDDEVENEEIDDAEGEDGSEGGDDKEGDLSAEHRETDRKDDGAAEGREERAVKSNRGENRFQTIANRAKAAEDRAERLEKEFQELRQRTQQDNGRQAQEEARQRRAIMTPEELMRDDLRLATEQNNSQLRAMEMRLYEQSDKQTFDATVRDSGGRFVKYVSEVEKLVKENRQQGGNLARDAVLNYLIGKDVRERGGQAKTKQAAKGQSKIDSQRVRPSNSRGDQGSDNRPRGGGEQAARERRLTNLNI
jgi:hypothetical protein